jgi:uncharacterized protein (TIGR03435 family)
VVDTTGLAGRYDFDLEFAPDDSRGMITVPATSGAGAPSVAEPVASIYSSIQQLGLKLEARKVPLDAIVVDAAEKTPTGN